VAATDGDLVEEDAWPEPLPRLGTGVDYDESTIWPTGFKPPLRPSPGPDVTYDAANAMTFAMLDALRSNIPRPAVPLGPWRFPAAVVCGDR
jgi:hypothetical protein